MKLVHQLRVAFPCYRFIPITRILLVQGFGSCLIGHCATGLSKLSVQALYDRGRKTEEQPAPSAHRRGLFGSVSCTLLVHPCSCLSEKNRLVTNGVHLVREVIFSERRQCKTIQTDPRFPCSDPFPLRKIAFSLRFSPVPFGLPPPTLKT